jgi:hypothetical protein
MAFRGITLSFGVHYALPVARFLRRVRIHKEEMPCR